MHPISNVHTESSPEMIIIILKPNATLFHQIYSILWTLFQSFVH